MLHTYFLQVLQKHVGTCCQAASGLFLEERAGNVISDFNFHFQFTDVITLNPFARKAM